MTTGEIAEAQWQRTKDDFSRELGRAVAAWSYLESGLASYFQRLTQMEAVTARRVFYSIAGFDGRARALISVADWVKTQPDITEFLNKLIGKARHYSATRNFIMHGDVIEVAFAQSRYFGQVILLNGRQPWQADPPEDEVMTIDQLGIATENFATLAGCVHSGLNWNGTDTVRSPTGLIELITEMPRQAHKARLDLRIAARFQPNATTLRHWR
jgi:hypothetical protein